MSHGLQEILEARDYCSLEFIFPIFASILEMCYGMLDNPTGLECLHFVQTGHTKFMWVWENCAELKLRSKLRVAK